MQEAELRQIHRYVQGQGLKLMDDLMIIEKEVALRLNGRLHGTFFCTPTHLDELAVGSLAIRGEIRSPRDIKRIAIKQDEVDIEIEIEPSAYRAAPGDDRGAQPAQPVRADDLLFLMQNHLKHSTLHMSTGGVHVMSIGRQRELLLTREDIGRHNAVDKIFGYCLLQQIDLHNTVFFSSGRITHEIITKLMFMGCELVVSRAAVSTRAMDCAQQAGITLVGFARERRFNIYTHPGRILI